MIMGRLKEEIERLMEEQLRQWPEFAGRVERMCSQGERRLDVDGHTLIVRDNPARIISTTARVTMEAAHRDGSPDHCMLCPHNRPPEQRPVTWQHGGGWQVLVNPYPIVEGHYTIVSERHEPQSLTTGVIVDMLQLTRELPGYVITYNGPRCGASIPWHLHLQAMPLAKVPLGSLPFPHVGPGLGLAATRDNVGPGLGLAALEETGTLRSDTLLPLPCLVITGGENQAQRVTDAIHNLPNNDKTAEPMLNAMAWIPTGESEPVVVIVPRRRHRPSCFGTGPGQLLWSPGVIDLMGLVTLPRREDFDAVTADQLRQAYAEISAL